MATLEDLRRGVFPLAGAVHGDAATDRDVAWVRVLKARVPAFDALEPGDLAILPEAALRALVAGGVEAGSIVEAIARSGGAGALLVGEGSEDAAVSAALARAAELGLPAWRLAPADAGEVERSVIGYLVNARAELERRGAELESQLSAAALGGHDLSALAAIMAAFLGRAVAIEGPRGSAAAVHAPASVPGAAAAAARYLANRRQVVLRTPLPGGGAVAILGDPPATELERVATTRVAALLALELGRQADGGRGSGDRAAGDVMPGDGPPWVVLMGRQLVSGAEAGLDERERLRARIARLAPGRRLRLRGDAGSLELRLVAATSAADPLGLVIAARVADAADRAIAASRPFQLTDDRPLAEQEARSTLEAVEPDSEAGRSGRVLRADRLPAYRLLGSLHNVPDGLRQARLLLAPVLVGRAATQRERLATLRAVLERPGLAEAATALGIHRNTLAYRIGRIEASTGWRLDDPELRFVLVMAIRLVQDAQDASGA